MESTLNVRQDETLKQAVLNNDIARVEELLNIGMDVNIMYPVSAFSFGPPKTKFETLLTIVCRRFKEGENIDMIKLLIKYGADVNKDGRDNISIDNISVPPLIMSILYDRKDAFELLLKNNADPNIYNIHDGNTPLHYCVDRNKYEMLNILLKYSADPNIYNNVGDTPLHLCVYKDRYEMTKILFNNGADPDIKNNKGKTSYELSMDYYFNGLNYQGKIYYFLENQKKLQQKLQEAEQKLAFMSSLNPRLGVNAFNKTNYDIYEDIASRPIKYNHSVYNRVRDEKRRNPLTKSKQYSAFMRGIQTNTGPFSAKSVRYEPNIMEGIFGHLSNMRPDARVHTRIDQQNKRTKKRKRR